VQTGSFEDYALALHCQRDSLFVNYKTSSENQRSADAGSGLRVRDVDVTENSPHRPAALQQLRNESKFTVSRLCGEFGAGVSCV